MVQFGLFEHHLHSEFQPSNSHMARDTTLQDRYNFSSRVSCVMSLQGWQVLNITVETNAFNQVLTVLVKTILDRVDKTAQSGQNHVAYINILTK